jgi:uncharacterized protein YbbK (DUF523 family)
VKKEIETLKKILVSACLCGDPCRYDGKAVPCDDPTFVKWLGEGRFVQACPEVLAGLGVPRGESQRLGDRVVTIDGRDVTEEFHIGAQMTVDLAMREEVTFCILKQRSPSCGSRIIHDGTFSGVKIPGHGVTTEKLRQAGYVVVGEDQMEEAIRLERELK